jgi:hypothetical protein
MEQAMKHMSPAERKQMEAGMKADMNKYLPKNAYHPNIKFRKGAKDKRISGWRTKHYVGYNGKRREMDIWMADFRTLGIKANEFQQFQILQKNYAKTARQIGVGTNINSPFGFGSLPKGFPVRTVTYEGKKRRGLFELKEVKRRSFPASTFKIPKGYKGSSMGGMMNGRGQ